MNLIRPDEASEILGDFLDSGDDEIVDAVEEALAMAEGVAGRESWDDAGDDEDE